jgi:hypothetical protein
MGESGVHGEVLLSAEGWLLLLYAQMRRISTGN